MEFKIKDIGTVITGNTPSKKYNDAYGSLIPFLTPRDMVKNIYVSSTERSLSSKGLDLLKAKLCNYPSISVSCIGSDMGKVTLNDFSLITNQQINTITDIDETICYPKYLYYLLSTMKEFFHNIAGGSTMPIINKTSFEQIEICLPDITTQQKVGDFLSSYDQKLKINHEIIIYLEQLAQTLFKRWFVDFEFPNENGDPYKSSDGEMVESELGMIPVGWKVGTLSQITLETLSGDWGKEYPEKNHQSQVSIIRGADIPELRSGRQGKVPVRYILEKNYSKKRLISGDVVIEVSGGSPTQSTGRSMYIDKALLNQFTNKVVSTNFCRVIRPKSEAAGYFMQSLLLHLYNQDRFFQLENGTTGIKNLDINNLIEKFGTIIPADDVIENFYQQTNIGNVLIQHKGAENRKLENLRDTLLPKLLSGEIELPEETEVIEDVPVS